MILNDQITVTYAGGKKETLRASVGTKSGKLESNGIEGVYFVEILRAVVPPRDGFIAGIPVHWRGEDYEISEAPLVRRRNGRDHHMTLSLKRTSLGGP